MRKQTFKLVNSGKFLCVFCSAGSFSLALVPFMVTYGTSRAIDHDYDFAKEALAPGCCYWKKCSRVGYKHSYILSTGHPFLAGSTMLATESVRAARPWSYTVCSPSPAFVVSTVGREC